MGEPRILRGTSRARDPVTAATELAAQIGQPMATTFVYTSPRHDLDVLGPALQDSFRGSVVGCTTAGELTPFGYQTGSLTGFSIPRAIASVRLWPIQELSATRPEAFAELAREASARAGHAAAARPGARHFGILLVDGMCRREEEVIGHIGPAMPQIPVVGGSAGDDRRHEKTCILIEGRFVPDAALLAVFTTERRFAAIKSQNFEPTEAKLVITEVERDERLVRRIDGRPAAEAYAEVVGVDVHALGEEVFSAHPLMLRAGGEYYVRSIRQAHEDGSLSFYCAIDEGLVVTVARSVDLVDTLKASLSPEATGITRPELVIGFECLHRRLEAERRGITTELGTVMAAHNVIGFHGYGEQANSVHINQTFTGIVLGGPE